MINLFHPARKQQSEQCKQLPHQLQHKLLHQKQPNNYWFILGRESLLALAEVSAVLRSSYNIKSFGGKSENNIFKINASINPSRIIIQLGGIIKIGREIGDDLTRIEIENKIIEELKKTDGKIHFGISYYGYIFSLSDIQRLGLNIKKQLKQQRYSIRYVANREIILNSASIVNNGLLKRGKEFLISDAIQPKQNRAKDLFDIAVTEAVQPFEDFSLRDFGRPGRDDYSGMLPPKLAMMMINIAQAKLDDLILDPFCGSGTILSEALLMGYNNLVGMDISKKAIEDAKNNIDWIIKNFKLPASSAGRQDLSNKIGIKQCDVNDISTKIKSDSVSAIITEPYLGKPLRGRETEAELSKQTSDLKQLYLKAFEEFKQILKKDGIVVFVIPRFKYNNDWLKIDCLSEIKTLGFVSQPLLDGHDYILYHRPGQFVGREIWRFKYID